VWAEVTWLEHISVLDLALTTIFFYLSFRRTSGSDGKALGLIASKQRGQQGALLKPVHPCCHCKDTHSHRQQVRVSLSDPWVCVVSLCEQVQAGLPSREGDLGHKHEAPSQFTAAQWSP
jgi:hypothetical protein